MNNLVNDQREQNSQLQQLAAQNKKFSVQQKAQIDALTEQLEKARQGQQQSEQGQKTKHQQLERFVQDQKDVIVQLQFELAQLLTERNSAAQQNPALERELEKEKQNFTDLMQAKRLKSEKQRIAEATLERMQQQFGEEAKKLKSEAEKWRAEAERL